MLSVDELPDEHRGRIDPCMDHPDDFELRADGTLEPSLAYWRRRLVEPLPGPKWGGVSA